jgi:hypothetical protein
VAAAGSAAGSRQLTLGHFAAARWRFTNLGPDRPAERPEVLVSGEGLGRGLDVLGTILHEATHGLAMARGIKDTSRQGRFHNLRFKALAEEMGQAVAKADPMAGPTPASPQRPPAATATR